MVIPADLPPLVAPVAWMLGTWRGWGTRAADGADAPVVEEVRGDVVGDQMRLVTRVYEGTADKDVDPTWDAASGLSAIARGPLLVEETLYVSVAPSDAPLPPPGQHNPRAFTASGATTGGHASAWDGMSMGPRLRMVSEAIARVEGSERVVHYGRMFGLVAGELMWTQERTLEGADEAVVEFSGRLMRAEQAADTAEGPDVAERAAARREGADSPEGPDVAERAAARGEEGSDGLAD